MKTSRFMSTRLKCYVAIAIVIMNSFFDLYISIISFKLNYCDLMYGCKGLTSV